MSSSLSGVAMAKYAPNKENAQKLVDFLASGEAQEISAAQVFEYPVMPGKEPADIVKSFGTIKPATLPLADIAANRKKFRGTLGRGGEGWQIVWSDEPPPAKPGARVSSKRAAARPVHVLGFVLDEVREARLAPMVNFKGRAARGANGTNPATDQE